MKLLRKGCIKMKLREVYNYLGDHQFNQLALEDITGKNQVLMTQMATIDVFNGLVDIIIKGGVSPIVMHVRTMMFMKEIVWNVTGGKI